MNVKLAQRNFLKYKLNRNKKLVHEGMKHFICESCDKKFTSKQMLVMHISAIHENKKDFKCNSCEKTFSQKASLQRHFRLVHEKKRALKKNLNVGPVTKPFLRV